MAVTRKVQVHVGYEEPNLSDRSHEPPVELYQRSQYRIRHPVEADAGRANHCCSQRAVMGQHENDGLPPLDHGCGSAYHGHFHGVCTLLIISDRAYTLRIVSHRRAMTDLN